MNKQAFKYLAKKHGTLFAVCWLQNRKQGLSPVAAYQRVNIAIVWS